MNFISFSLKYFSKFKKKKIIVAVLLEVNFFEQVEALLMTSAGPF